MENTTRHFKQNCLWMVAWVTIISAVLIFVWPYYPKHWPFESRAELERIRTALPLAEAKWYSHNIREYEFDIQGGSHPLMCGEISEHKFLPWHFTARDGEIIYDDKVNKEWIEDCRIVSFMPPKVFETIRQMIEDVNSESQFLKVEFDPVYGFVSYYYLTSNNASSTFNVSYSISNFYPKTP